MEAIEHRTVNVNRINMHVAEKGKGPQILFIHGFPELWYTWRHQMLALASLGYRAVATATRTHRIQSAATLASSWSAISLLFSMPSPRTRRRCSLSAMTGAQSLLGICACSGGTESRLW
ncbi:hypothetical protein SLE2022_002240 [Rubroshorea leprosula]